VGTSRSKSLRKRLTVLAYGQSLSRVEQCVTDLLRVECLVTCVTRDVTNQDTVHHVSVRQVELTRAHAPARCCIVTVWLHKQMSW